MTPRSQAEILGDKFIISVTDEERRQFLQWVRDYSNSRKLGRPGVRDAGYYHLRDKPWSFIRPDYEIERPDGSIKKVLWSDWTKNQLIKARKLWIAGGRGPDALDPDLLDDDGDASIQGWKTHASVEEWTYDIPELHLDPWEGQPKRVLVLCEKAGVRGIVEDACRPTRTNFMCCGGDAHLKQKQNVGQWAAAVKKRGLEPIILYAGDHDMQGVNMDRTWVRDVAEIDSVTRVAITLEQARKYNLPTESAHDKMHGGAGISPQRTGQNTKIQNYIDEHGGEMIELNALLERDEFLLRDIIRDEIAKHIDRDIWGERQKEIEEPTSRISEVIDELREELG